MSAIANITVYDGAATPVAHTLSAISVTRENGVTEALYRELLSTIPTEAQVSATIREKMLSSGVKQVELRVNVPVMESVAGNNAAGYTAAPKVAYVDSFVVTNYQHPRSTVTSRRLARMLAVNIANNISASVAAATSGPASEAFDSQVLPT